MKKEKLRLDLACGNNKQKGFIGIDITKKETKADIEHNLLKDFPWPFEDNSVDEVFCSHFLEHIPQGDGYHDPLWDFFNELWRILKPGAGVRFVCPYYTSVRAFQDPTHHRFINEPMFQYFDKEWRKLNKLEHYPVHTNFKVVKIDHSVSEEFIGKAQDAVSYQAMHMWNVVTDIMVTLQKPKLDKTK